MPLILQIPAHLSTTWSTEHLRIGPLLPCPDDVPAWVRDVMCADLAPSTSLEPGGLVDAETRDGWRFRIADARVVDASAVSMRLGAFYRFFERVASVMVDLPADARGRANEALDIFRTARPDFSSMHVGLRGLWEL